MTIKLTYAGHSAFFVDISGVHTAIDPWLEGNPSCPENLKNPSKLDLIILTHGHSDHAGDVIRVANNTGAKVAATFELAMILIQEGIPGERVIPMNKGGTVPFGSLKISLTNAFHSNSYDTAKGPLYAGEACGVVLSTETESIFHSGDTALFSDLKLIGEIYKPKIACLPIGDRFTMGPTDAALAAKWLGCEVVVPMHYATFDALTGTAEQFEAECKRREVACRILKPGEHFEK